MDTCFSFHRTVDGERLPSFREKRVNLQIFVLEEANFITPFYSPRSAGLNGIIKSIPLSTNMLR